MTEAPPPCEECEWYLTHTDGGQHAKALHAEIAELRGNTELERGLTEFRKEMLAKFSLPRVVAKQGKSSVTIDGNLDRMALALVEKHFREEIAERMAALTSADCLKEDVDVANMAFLDWWCQRRAALAKKEKP